MDTALLEPRPRALTSEQRLAIARKLADTLILNGLMGAEDLEETAEQILECAPTSYTDGYAIARRLDERHDWSCNIEIAGTLDDWSGECGLALREAQRAWAKRTGIQPPYETGRHVRIPSGETGHIAGICSFEPATYLIAIDGNDTPSRGKRVIYFEDVTPTDAPAEAAAA